MAHFCLLRFEGMFLVGLFSRNLNTFPICIAACLGLLGFSAFVEESVARELDAFVGPKVGLQSHWVGSHGVKKNLPILVMAGHADSQGLAGSGTPGAAVALNGALPMDSNMSDELFWNLLVRDAVVRVGRQKGLTISSYDPGIRNIENGNDPRTNWSVGARYAREGVYVIEIHFDSYGEYGYGSGLIPAITRRLNTVDESLAKTFGRYPLFFRGGLGAARRGIRILEIGKLEGPLEASLRDINQREMTVQGIALEITKALINGLSD